MIHVIYIRQSYFKTADCKRYSETARPDSVGSVVDCYGPNEIEAIPRIINYCR
jgi:hypothetical protein